jgi:hypothetical protein
VADGGVGYDISPQCFCFHRYGFHYCSPDIVWFASATVAVVRRSIADAIARFS